MGVVAMPPPQDVPMPPFPLPPLPPGLPPPGPNMSFPSTSIPLPQTPQPPNMSVPPPMFNTPVGLWVLIRLFLLCMVDVNHTMYYKLQSSLSDKNVSVSSREEFWLHQIEHPWKIVNTSTELMLKCKKICKQYFTKLFPKKLAGKVISAQFSTFLSN